MRTSYEPNADAGRVVVRHLAIAKRSTGIVRDARVRLIEAVLAWSRGEVTSDNFRRQLKSKDFNEFEVEALAVLVPETLAIAWLKQKGLQTVMFKVTDRFQQGHSLEPSEHPVFQLAVDFAAEAFELPAMPDFQNEYYRLASMSSMMDAADKSLEESADLTGTVSVVLLNAPSAEEFGLGLDTPVLQSPTSSKPWWKLW